MQIPSGSYTQSPDTTFEKKSHSTKDSVISVEKRKQEIEELDDAIGKMSHTINAANYELMVLIREFDERAGCCLLYTSPSPRDATLSRMPSSA